MQVPSGSQFSNAVTPYSSVGKQPVGQENIEAKGTLFSGVEESSKSVATENRKPTIPDPPLLTTKTKPSEEKRKIETTTSGFISDAAKDAQRAEIERLERLKALQDQALLRKFSAQKQTSAVKQFSSPQLAISLAESSDPEQTLQNASRLKAQALSPPPSLPTPADLQLADKAARLQAQARFKIAETKYHEKVEQKTEDRRVELRKQVLSDVLSDDGSEVVLVEADTETQQATEEPTSSDETVESSSDSTESETNSTEDSEETNTNAAEFSNDPDAQLIGLAAIDANNPSGSIRYAVEQDDTAVSVSDIGTAIGSSFSGTEAVKAYISTQIATVSTVTSPVEVPNEAQIAAYSRRGSTSASTAQINAYFDALTTAQATGVYSSAQAEATSEIIETTSEEESTSDIRRESYLAGLENAGETKATSSINQKFINALNDVAKTNTAGKVTTFEYSVIV